MSCPIQYSCIVHSIVLTYRLQPVNMYLGAVGMEQRNARERRHSFDTRSTPSCTVVARSFPVTISLRKRMQREIRRTYVSE